MVIRAISRFTSQRHPTGAMELGQHDPMTPGARRPRGSWTMRWIGECPRESELSDGNALETLKAAFFQKLREARSSRVMETGRGCCGLPPHLHRGGAGLSGEVFPLIATNEGTQKAAM